MGRCLCGPGHAHSLHIAAYIGVLERDPFGVLFAFGGSLLVCGQYYKTPFPVQPMKAIGAAAAAQAVQTAVVTPNVVYAAALFTGVVWLVLGLTGAAHRLARLVPAEVVVGIVLGLGLGFMLEGVKMMQTGWTIAAVGSFGTLLLMGNRTLPAMFALLAGAVVGASRSPALLTGLAQAGVTVHWPQFALSTLSWDDLFVGACCSRCRSRSTARFGIVTA